MTTCSCTRYGPYWSSTTYAYHPDEAWLLYFSYGLVDPMAKDNSAFVRAVRDGWTVPASTCGNGVANGDEQCDGLDLGGATCGSLVPGLTGTLGCTAACQFDVSGCSSSVSVGGLLATGRTTSYGTGDDGDLQAGAPLSYVDNGDGTVTDLNTGLTWEKKDDNDAGSVHDWDNLHTWSASELAYDGTLVTVFLDKLNNYCDDDEATACTTDAECVGAADTYASNDLCGHAGYHDWRLPNVRELHSIVNYEIPLPGGPTVDPVFNSSCGPGCTVASCSCTHTYDTWSSTTFARQSPAYAAWFVGFYSGYVGPTHKYSDKTVRAVRGGL